MQFTHLHTHSHYSLLDGLPKIDDLVQGAKALGMTALALTDHGTMYGALEFYQKAKKAGIKPIIGCEMYIAHDKLSNKRPGVDNKRYHLTVLVRNYEGYKNLMRLVTIAHLEGYYYKPRIDKEHLKKHSEGLMALSGCMSSEISQAILARRMDAAEKLVEEYRDIFGKDYFFLELGAHATMAEQKIVNDALIELSKKTGVPLVATNDIHYVKKDDKEAQDILVSVQTGSTVNDGDRMTMKNEDFSMKTADEMLAFFPDHPEAIENTNKIADMVNLEIPLGAILLPKFPLPAGETNNEEYLKKLCTAGIPKRYPNAAAEKLKEVEARLEYELSVINKMGFASYFLIVHDFVDWAKNHKIVVGPGRGSAAGSLVSYLLNITNLDPLEYSLLFERFLNPSRISMPDIDLDFADTRRDEVLQYVVEKYGKEHFAQIITFGTMAARAAIRDTGRALGYPYGFCDQLSKMIPFNPTQGMKVGWLDDCLKNVPDFKNAYANNPDARRLIDSALKLEGVVRHASTHACGVVIGPEPLYNYLPLQFPTKHNETKEGSASVADEIYVTQYEMHGVEDLGLLKMDFLGLKNLSIIEDTIDKVKKNHGVAIDIDALPLTDEATFKIFQDGKTTGVFQFESSGMKRYLKELKPSEFEDIIAMVALYRPGPMELIPSYIQRKFGHEQITYLHPKLEPILKNTYGIGVYQEQMMQIARDLAGYSLAEADTLRKAIGKKIKALLDEQNVKLVKGMIDNGIDKKTAEAVWELFPPFARYGFNRSHAACYALVAYQTAYLKAHYPAEFMAALMTSELSDIERISFLIQEAKDMGISILPPSINESYETFTVIREADEKSKIRFGLSAIKNVGENIVKIIIAERKKNGPFAAMGDFVERIAHRDLNKKSMESLIKSGAMDIFGDRNMLVHNLDNILEYAREHQKNSSGGQVSLFAGTAHHSSDITLIPLKDEDEQKKSTERLQWEKELLGLYISAHPLQNYRAKFPHSVSALSTLTQNGNGKFVTIGAMVGEAKKILTKKGDPMLFVPVEDMSGRAEVLVFPRTLAATEIVWRPGTIAVIKGTVSDKDGTLKILCEDAVRIA